MLKKYLSKFTIDILPSVAATVIGAYIVNHYIVTKPGADAPVAAVSAADPKAKAEEKVVIIMAHRPAGIAECDTILIIDGGAAKAFGPRDEVLKAHVRNYAQVAGRIGQEAQG